ncbi:hypothetical protein DXG01_003780 [Tephrocybe rancida]|nr:hypothetical protein DXG01_003780 [Tephrocybe rancida]
MGITGLLPALKSIQVTKPLKEFAGQRIAVDAYVWLHRGVNTCATELATGKPTHKYVDYAMRHVRLLRHNNIEPYIVFDGGPLPAKKGTEDERQKRRDEARLRGDALAAAGKHSQARDHYLKSIDVSPRMAFQLIKALRAESVAYVVAPYEADAQLAYLERVGIVDAILTEDSDLLVFGCQNVLFKLDAVASTVVSISRKDFGSVCSPASDVISLFGWTDIQFRAMAILSGCDYLPSIHGIGLKTACSLLRKHKTVEHLVNMLQLEGKKTVPRTYMRDFNLADKCFQHQRVYCPLAEKLVYLTEVDADWTEEEEAYIGGDLDASLAKQLAMGDVCPISLLPIKDINPDFTPRVKPLSITRRESGLLDKGKGTSTPAREGILSFFGPNAKIPPRPREDRAPLSPIRIKTKTAAGKDSGKRTLAEVMDHDITKQRRQKSKFFDAPTPVSPKLKLEHPNAITGPSREQENKENIYHIISEDDEEAEIGSNVSIEVWGHVDEEMEIDIEDPTLCVLVTQEDGYISPTSSCYGEIQDLSSPVRPERNSNAQFTPRSRDLDFGVDAVSSPPSIAKRRRKCDLPPLPLLRTRSLDLPQPPQIPLDAPPSKGKPIAPTLVSFAGPDLRYAFDDGHSSEIDCSDEEGKHAPKSNSPTPPAPTPPTTLWQDSQNVDEDYAEDPTSAHEMRQKAVICGWKQHYSLAGGRAGSRRASLSKLSQRETNVTPSGRHTIPHPASRLRKSMPYPRTAPNSASKIPARKPRRAAESRKSLPFLAPNTRRSPSKPATMSTEDLHDVNLLAAQRLQKFRPAWRPVHIGTIEPNTRQPIFSPATSASMKRNANFSRIPSPFVDYGYDQRVSDSLFGSQPLHYPPTLLPQHGAYDSSRLLNMSPQRYLASPTFDRDGNGQMSYPESSQRTAVSDDSNSSSSPHASGGNVTDDAHQLSGSESDPKHMPCLLPQNRMLSPPPYVYDGSAISPALQDTSTFGNIPLHPVPDNPPYSRASPESLQSSPYLVHRNTIQEKPNLPGRYETSPGSGVSIDRYAIYNADSPHDLGNSHHSPTMSSIPMRNNMSTGAGDELASLLVVSGESTLVNSSDTTVFSSYEYPDQRNRDAAASPTSSVADDVVPPVKKKKSKMHQCEVCGKMFPRPSGLKTHMNTHNNLKPFPCGFEGCSRTFTVRSNAKRHLRTHGVETSTSRLTVLPPYTVGFDTPTVLPPIPGAAHELSKIPYRLRWMPPSLSSRKNSANLASVSDDESSDDEYEYTSEQKQGLRDIKSAVTVPCRPVVPTPSEYDPHELFEERNSYIEAPRYPYHPSQVSITTFTIPAADNLTPSLGYSFEFFPDQHWLPRCRPLQRDLYPGI